MKFGVTVVKDASVVLKTLAWIAGGFQVLPNGQVYAVVWTVKVGFSPSMHTGLLVGFGLFRVTYNRQGF